MARGCSRVRLGKVATTMSPMLNRHFFFASGTRAPSEPMGTTGINWLGQRNNSAGKDSGGARIPVDEKHSVPTLKIEAGRPAVGSGME